MPRSMKRARAHLNTIARLTDHVLNRNTDNVEMHDWRRRCAVPDGIQESRKLDGGRFPRHDNYRE